MSRHRALISLFFPFLILSLVYLRVNADPVFAWTASNGDQTSELNVNFEIRFVYDSGLFKVNLATAWGSFRIYDKVEGENVTTFYGFSNKPRFESGTTLLGRPLVQGIAVGEYWLAHVYVFKNGTVIWCLPGAFSLLKWKLIRGGITDVGGSRDVERGQHPFWGPEIGEDWGISILYPYPNQTIWRFNREDIAGVRTILYLFDTYLVFSDGTYWRPGPRQIDPALTSIIAVEQEFNITDSGWTAGTFTLETRNFTQTHFDPATKTLTIYVNHLPNIFYYDAALLMGSIAIISLISVATFVLLHKRRSKSKQAVLQTGDLQATEFR